MKLLPSVELKKCYYDLMSMLVIFAVTAVVDDKMSQMFTNYNLYLLNECMNETFILLSYTATFMNENIEIVVNK